MAVLIRFLAFCKEKLLLVILLISRFLLLMEFYFIKNTHNGYVIYELNLLN